MLREYAKSFQMTLLQMLEQAGGGRELGASQIMERCRGRAQVLKNNLIRR